MSVSSGLLQSTEPTVRLCPHCARSLARWFERGLRSASRELSDRLEGSSSKKPRRHHRKKGETGVPRKLMLALYAIFAIATSLLVWMLIKNVTRPIPD
jgi:hypothetical protein